MRSFVLAAAIVAVSAAPSRAQSFKGYVDGVGGFASAPDATSGNLLGEVGVRVAPNLFVFGDVGQMRNVQPTALQSQIDVTTALLASSSGLDVQGTARVPATYGLGGVRYEARPIAHLSPYVFGGLGIARISPAATFSYSSGTLTGATPATGDDVTSQIVSLGDFTQPASTNALMTSFGGGVTAPIVPRVMVDIGYRFARISADTPFNANSLVFGLGYRF